MQHPQKIKDYIVEKQLGRGGMGEVFLVKDPLCQRWLALKIIREDMRHSKTIRKRFLQEAKIAARLTHPCIVPIYSIYEEEDTHFYTMPYVHGETLKEILKKTREEEKAGKISHPIGSSIPSLLRIFLSICEAIAYSHSQGILHRDLKPDNIIIGKYGETFLLDWGLACLQEESEEESHIHDLEIESNLTKPGKIPGTLSHISPERVLGGKSSIKSDIYALGVILYQILTLRLPFHRANIQMFKKIAGTEKMLDPCEVSPHRDIPPFLSDIAKKCLDSDPAERYDSVEKLINDIKTYIEGKPKWLEVATCDIRNPVDWIYQELIPTTEYKAVLNSSDSLEWLMVMLAKARAPGNFCLETTLCFLNNAQGLGFILDAHKPSLNSLLDNSMVLWLSPEEGKSCILYQSHAAVMQSSFAKLQTNKTYKLKIEKIENHLFVFIDDTLILNYLSHIPMSGEHFGLLCKDHHFNLSALILSSGAQRTMVSCLSIPDTFLSKGDFDFALEEYRKLALSFAGRSEGREALYRAGLTLLEKGNRSKNKKEKDKNYLLALEEFGKLRKTPGAPMEYLGKSLVYQKWKDLEEEVKCLELALRKYSSHPLTHLIFDQIFFRLHQSAAKDRKETLTFALLAIRLVPNIFSNVDNQHLLHIVEKILSPLLPLLPHTFQNSENDRHQLLSMQLALELNKPFVLMEIIEKSASLESIENALMCLLHLNHLKIVQEMLPLYESQGGNPSFFKKTIKALSSDLALRKYLESKDNVKECLWVSSAILLTEKTMLAKAIKKERLELLHSSKTLQHYLKNYPYLKNLYFSLSLFLRSENVLEYFTKENSQIAEANIYQSLAYIAINKGKPACIETSLKMLQEGIDDPTFVFLQLISHDENYEQISSLMEKRSVGNSFLISLIALNHHIMSKALAKGIEMWIKTLQKSK